MLSQRRQYPLSPTQYFMLAGASAHSAWRAAADSEMEVSAYFTSVHIPPSGRAVTGNAADSEMEVGPIYLFHKCAYTVFWKGSDRHSCRQRNGSICLFHKCAYTVFWKGFAREKRAQWRQHKGSIYLIYKWAYTAFWQHRYTPVRNEWDTQTATDSTKRTEVKQHVPTSVYRGET